MSNIVVRIGMLGFAAIVLTACGKSEEKKTETTPGPVAATPVTTTPVATTDGQKKMEGDPALASRQLAIRKSATDAARCQIVFTTAVGLASQSGDSKGVARMNRAAQATQYVLDVAVADRGESPQQIKNAQAAANFEAQSWSQQKFETYIGECTKQFSDLAPLMAQAGLLK
jgi:hypothetical protein